MIASLTVDSNSADGFTLINGDLKKNGKYYIRDNTDLRQSICSAVHSQGEVGYSDITTSIKRAERKFYWPTLRQDFTKFIQECDTWQRNKSEHNLYPGLLRPIEIPTQIWEVVSVDFIEGLPRSKGKDVILVVVDKLTKYYHLLAWP